MNIQSKSDYKSLAERTVFYLAAAVFFAGFLAVPFVFAAAIPVITLNGDANLTLAYGSAYNEQGALCQDAAGTQLEVATTGFVDTLTSGTYTIAYDCQDSNGNKAERVNRSVTVSAKPYWLGTLGTMPVCTKVVFGEWRPCVNGSRSRSMTSLDNAYCSFSAEQIAGEQQACTVATGTSATAPVIPSVAPVGSAVLGVKIYPVGTLLRTPDHKIYVIIATNTVKYISSLKELRAYGGHEIFNVSSEVLAPYRQVLGLKIYPNGTLLRGPDHKIYAIIAGKKHHILDLAELSAYPGQPIHNVSADDLANY